MPDDPRVDQLLDALLEADATPEAVCAACPELLPAVRRRWWQVCQARAELDALFPPAGESDPGRHTPRPGDTPPPDLPGYAVEAVLGRGGMGVVYRARHLRLNRVVAVKVGLAGSHLGPHERERLRREAETVAALRHPNVVQVHDTGEAHGQPFLSMEFVEGGSLAQKLAGTPLPAREAAELVAAVAGAVQAAHAAGIVHRDLKPANVLLAADGTPKVSDFGLARRVGGEAGLTRTGTAVGTPSYMAPEQARGGPAVGPVADVYALGAVLYECLTGRPPFRAETAAETVQQVLTQDPVPPTRLNRTVPRDLETVCLKCLSKSPPARYPSAAELADDLGRFLRGEPVLARPVGWLGRLARRVRRRPALAAAVAVAVLSVLALAGGGGWVLADRAATRRGAAAEQAAVEAAADADMREMNGLLFRAAWAEARAALERAKGRLGGRPAAELTDRIDRAEAYLGLAARLEAIRLDGYTVAEDGLDFRRSDGEYAAAFRQAELLDPDRDTPAEAAERVAGTAIRPAVVAALDHWSACCWENPGRKAWLLETARLADPDPTGWRARSSDPAVWKDDVALARLIESAPTAYPSLPFLLLVEVRMADADRDAVPYLRLAQRAHPGDFWVNARLARLLHPRDPREAVRFYQAALAVRPDAVAVLNDLGRALEESGRRDEAVEQYRRAVALAPTLPVAQTNLAVILSRLDRHREAIDQCEQAFRLGVRTAGIHTAVGLSLKATGRPEAALAELRRAVVLNPQHLAAQSGLRAILLERGDLAGVQSAWRDALAADPPMHEAWYGYAELCLYRGDEAEYGRARRALLAKFGGTTDPYTAERTARAGLLRPVSGDDLNRAAKLADRAAGIERSKYGGAYPHFLFVRGLADYRRGQLDRAISTMRGDAAGVLGPAPRLVLAMALHQTGRAAEARKVLAEATRTHDWQPTRARSQDDWIYHALRREADELIGPP